MSNMQADVYAALRSIEIPEDKALKAAEALNRRDEDVAALRTDMAVLKWGMAAILGFQFAIFGKLFIR